MAKLDAALITQLFRLADEDRDGAVGGAEAVKFFGRSGLPQECLVQVWELASNGAAKLNNAQFGAALRLVSLAQVSGGRLPLDQARTTLAGLGPALPTPRLAGLEQYGVTYSPQTTGAYAAQVTGGYQPQVSGGYAPQTTGGSGYAPQNTGGYAQQTTGGYVAQPVGYTAQGTGGYVAQGTGGYVAQSTGGGPGGYPAPSAADLQRYQAMFMQLDTDRDGILQGGECFNTFLQWGLDKAVLKDVWDKVAGDAGHLTGPQFCQALNLMDLARRSGGHLPLPPPPPQQQQPSFMSQAPLLAAAAPPAAAPHAAAQWTLQSQFGARGPQPPAAAPVVPVAPIPPGRFEYHDQATASVAAAPPSRVPAIPQAGFSDIESAKLAKEAKEAAAREAELRATQEEAAKSKARVRAYNEALQELAVFKSRNDIALLEAQDQAARLQEEARATQAKYDMAYGAAQNAGEESRLAVDKVQALVQARGEAEEKLRALQQEVAAADHQLAPAQVFQLQSEVTALQLQVDQGEVFKKSKLQQIDAMRGQRVALESRVAEIQSGLVQAEAELEGAGAEVGRLQAAAEQLRAGGTSGGQAQVLLVRAARAYRSLLATVLRCGMELPFEADLLNNGGLLVQGKNESTGALLAWVDDVMAGVADWNYVDAAGQGFVLVNATDSRLPPAALMPNLASASFKAPRPAAAAAAAAPAAPPSGLGAPSGFDDDAFEAPPPPPRAAPAPAAVAPVLQHIVPPLPTHQPAAAAAAAAAAAPEPAAPAATEPQPGPSPAPATPEPLPEDSFSQEPAAASSPVPSAPAAAAAAASSSTPAPAPAAVGFGDDLAFGSPAVAARAAPAAEPPAPPAAPQAPAAAAAAEPPPPPPPAAAAAPLFFNEDAAPFDAAPPPPPPAPAAPPPSAPQSGPSTPRGFGDFGFGDSAFGSPPAFPAPAPAPAPAAPAPAAPPAPAPLPPAPAAAPPPPPAPTPAAAPAFAMSFDDDAFV